MSSPQTSRKDLPWPTSTPELDLPERFIVWSFRRWVLGLKENSAAHWDLVWSEFSRQMGARDGQDALSGFAGMVKVLQGSARRRIRHHPPCSPYLTADEVSILCFVAACQNGQQQLARSVAEWLVEADGIEEMIKAGKCLAGRMQCHSLVCPERCCKRPTPQAAESTPQNIATLH